MFKSKTISTTDLRLLERKAISEWLDDGSIVADPDNRLPAQMACLAFHQSEQMMVMKSILGKKYKMSVRSFGRYFTSMVETPLIVFRKGKKIYRGYSGVRLARLN